MLGDDVAPASLRIELASENDLFFHYMHVVDETGYRNLQEQQKLMVEYIEYPNVLIKMLKSLYLKLLSILPRRKKKEEPFSFKKDILKRYGKKEENSEES